MAMDDFRRDIFSQPQCLLDHEVRVREAIETVRSIKPQILSSGCVLTGMATSLYAWQCVEHELVGASLPGYLMIDTGEYIHYHRPQEDTRPVFVLSRSGESAEIVRLAEMLPGQRRVIGITEGKDSSLAARADNPMLFNAGEAAFPNTKSFTLSLIYALACTKALSDVDTLAAGSWLREAATALDVLLEGEEQASAVAASLAGCQAALVLGRGPLTGIVNQAALDFQEAEQLAAIPITGGLLRHGPVELTVRDDVVTLLLIQDDVTAPLALKVADDLAARSANVAVIASEGLSVPQGVPAFWVPRARPELAPVLFAVALHLVNYALAQMLGLRDISPALVGKVTRQE